MTFIESKCRSTGIRSHDTLQMDDKILVGEKAHKYL